MKNLFFSIKNHILDLFYPKICAGCASEGVLICRECEKAIVIRTPQCFICDRRSPDARVCRSCKKHTAYTRMYGPLSFKNDIVREMVHRLKYRSVKEYGVILGQFLAKATSYYALLPKKDAVIISVPLHPKRMRTRGFNQAEIIAKTYSELSNIPLADSESIIRRKNTPPQTTVADRSKRMENMRDVFFVKNATDFFGKTVILIDDVATTGSTINEAARALKRGGAREVWVFTAAR